MSGSVSGGLWGLVLGGVGLGVVSLVNEQPGVGDTPPAVQQLTVPEVAAVVEQTPVELTPATADETNNLAAEVPQVAEPVVEAAAPAVDATPIAPPQAPDLSELLALPETETGLGLADVAQEPGSSRVVVDALDAPAPDAAVVIATQPEEPPQPADVVADDVSARMPAVTAEAPAPALADTTSLPDATPEAPASVEPEVVEDPVAPVVVTQSPDVDVPETESGAEIVDVVPDVAPVVPEVASESPQPVIVTDDPAPQAPEPAPLIVTTPEPAPEEAQTGTTTVRVNRPGATPSETAGQVADVIEADPFPDDAPALERYATEFESPGDLPLIAIVMLDAGDMQSAAADIGALPVPVTVVINALHPDARAKMTAYRDAGVEVMLQTSLPQGAVPTDVEVAFEAAFAILPETVGFFSDASGIMQGNRSVAEQVVEILGAEGRGLIVVERGLSSSLRIAEQAGLPAAAVLRDLDGDGEDAGAVTQALDQAAFRARQSGDAVLLARVSAETLDALREWGAENNGDQIALAPVSAVLQGAAVTE